MLISLRIMRSFDSFGWKACVGSFDVKRGIPCLLGNDSIEIPRSRQPCM